MATIGADRADSKASWHHNRKCLSLALSFCLPDALQQSRGLLGPSSTRGAGVEDCWDATMDLGSGAGESFTLFALGRLALSFCNLQSFVCTQPVAEAV